jgi:hypothetical protein
MKRAMSGSWPATDFPALREEHLEVTSDATDDYNCIAWAADDTETWWWPDDPEIGYGYWPPNIPRAETILAFALAYATLGYLSCDDGSMEAGFEKIALYVSDEGIPTHAARQLPDSRWTSKLGPFEDIEHVNLECLQGPCYGKVAAYLKRAIFRPA